MEADCQPVRLSLAPSWVVWFGGLYQLGPLHISLEVALRIVVRLSDVKQHFIA